MKMQFAQLWELHKKKLLKPTGKQMLLHKTALHKKICLFLHSKFLTAKKLTF